MQSGENSTAPEEATLVAVFKRTLSFVIPTALICLAIQYHQTGRMTVFGIAAYLITLLVTGMLLEGLNVWWGQRFGTRKSPTIAQAVFWLAAAVCMYLFFRHLDRE